MADEKASIPEDVPSGTLNYLAPPEVSSELQLRANDKSVRVIFAVLPLWLDLLFIVISGLVGFANIALAIAVPLIIASVIPRAPNGPAVHQSIWALVKSVSITHLLSGLMWLVFAGFPLYRLRRWGRVPRKLTATRSGLVVSDLGWLQRPRSRFWPAEQITAVVIQQSGQSLFSKRAVATMRISRRKWIPLYFRLSSTDAQLPAHIAERLAATLGCPVLIR